MDSQSTFSTMSETRRSNEWSIAAMVARLSQLTICVGIGMVGGTTGVALTIGLAVMIQSVLSPAVLFLPGTILLAIVTTLAGLGASWILGRIGYRIIPSLSTYSQEQKMQVVFVSSVLVSLLQTFLFTQTF